MGKCCAPPQHWSRWSSVAARTERREMSEGGALSSQDETRRKTVAVTSATSAQESDEPVCRRAVPPVLLTASVVPGSCSFQQVTNGRSIYRARWRRGARIVTSGSSRHIISCRQALTAGPSGEIKKDSCVSYTALSAELSVRPCQDVIIILLLLIRTVQCRVISFWSLTDAVIESYVPFSCLICRTNME